MGGASGGLPVSSGGGRSVDGGWRAMGRRASSSVSTSEQRRRRMRASGSVSVEASTSEVRERLSIECLFFFFFCCRKTRETKEIREACGANCVYI